MLKSDLELVLILVEEILLEKKNEGNGKLEVQPIISGALSH